MTITPTDLIAAGMKPGKFFPAAVQAANETLAEGGSFDEAIDAARLLQAPPVMPLHPLRHLSFYSNIVAANEAEQANVDAVTASMEELMRTPVVVAGAIMPDACPAGPLGTIPVGGVVASRAIHPGMHSADICCSMSLSVMPGTDPKALLDAVQEVTHFGPGGRKGENVVKMPEWIVDEFKKNFLLNDKLELARSNFATQGDGNHFAYVGKLKSTGETVLVTHHGSRGPGAALYKDGMRIAEKTRQRLSPATLKQNAWIEPETKDGKEYWEALQALRAWIKASHQAIHRMAAKKVGGEITRREFNEHNFVFLRDGLYYHAKGATPAFAGYAADDTGITIIPLNMSQPILLVRGLDAANGLGFSPHGAGRNFSRTQHKRNLAGRTDEEIFAEETKGIDARFYMGMTDISELPSAYKDAAAVRGQIEAYCLAEIVDEVLPYGSIMAGDWEKDAPWRKPKVA